MVGGDGTPSLDLFDTNGTRRATLSLGSASAELVLAADETRIRLADKEAFKTEIGNANLILPQTGETRKTSAASVLLSDKDEKVLWKAP